MASNRSTTLPWAVSSRRSKSPRPTTKGAAGCRSSRCMTASSSRRPTGSGATRRLWPLRSKRRNSRPAAVSYRGRFQRRRGTMRRLYRVLLVVGAGAAAGFGIAGAAIAQQKEVMVGQMCDRTGPTQINGVVLCPASHDYYNLINSQGGIEGYQIKSEELDHEYKVPQAVEAYQRMKGDGAVSIMAYGTPQVQALNQKFADDKIPGTSPGFGIAASADGKRFPYLFPIAATYWSQGAGAIQFVKDKLGGTLEGKKIAYIFYDNPAGREPIPIIEDLQKLEEFELS